MLYTYGIVINTYFAFSHRLHGNLVSFYFFRFFEERRAAAGFTYCTYSSSYSLYLSVYILFRVFFLFCERQHRQRIPNNMRYARMNSSSFCNSPVIFTLFIFSKQSFFSLSNNMFHLPNDILDAVFEAQASTLCGFSHRRIRIILIWPRIGSDRIGYCEYYGNFLYFFFFFGSCRDKIYKLYDRDMIRVPGKGAIND